MSDRFNSVALSFIGTDGSGKSTIANRLAGLISDEGGFPEVFGGSSYRDWLTADVASTHWGRSDLFTRPLTSFADRTLLYEAIAVVCYKRMDELRGQGVIPIIDSDPVSKRMIWAHLELPPHQSSLYCDTFQSMLRRELGDIYPDHLVHVGVDSEGDAEESVDILSRLEGRGIVSEFDPTHLSAVHEVVLATRAVWQRVSQHERVLSGATEVHFIDNSSGGQEDIQAKIDRIAQSLLPLVLS